MLVCYSFSCSKPGPSANFCIHYRHFTSLCYLFNLILWLSLLLESSCKEKREKKTRVLIMCLGFSCCLFGMRETGALDSVSCHRRQLAGARISPLALPGAESSQQQQRRLARLITDGETGTGSLTGNDEEGVSVLRRVEGFGLNQTPNRSEGGRSVSFTASIAW